jgi:hypothetical protein
MADLSGGDLGRVGSVRNWKSGSVREVWQGPPDVFSRNSTARRSEREEDEEELKWAAIERLPTYDRLKTGMLKQVTSKGRVFRNEIDVTKLGPQDKQQLMDSVLKVAETDNETFLRRIRDRADRVGIEFPTIEVRFENLTIELEDYEVDRPDVYAQ